MSGVPILQRLRGRELAWPSVQVLPPVGLAVPRPPVVRMPVTAAPAPENADTSSAPGAA